MKKESRHLDTLVMNPLCTIERRSHRQNYSFVKRVIAWVGQAKYYAYECKQLLELLLVLEVIAYKQSLLFMHRAHYLRSVRMKVELLLS